MQRDLRKLRRSDEEAIKERGLTLDLDEIARKGSISREEIAIAKSTATDGTTARTTPMR